MNWGVDTPLTYWNQTLPVKEWAELYDMPVRHVIRRLKSGWDASRALTAPINGPLNASHTLTHGGQTLTVAEWSAKTGLPKALIHSRKSRKWSDSLTLTTAKNNAFPLTKADKAIRRHWRRHKPAQK